MNRERQSQKMSRTASQYMTRGSNPSSRAGHAQSDSGEEIE